MTALPRGRCPVCRRDVALRRNGTVREHRVPIYELPTAHDTSPCDGSGRPAATAEAGA